MRNSPNGFTNYKLLNQRMYKENRFHRHTTCGVQGCTYLPKIRILREFTQDRSIGFKKLYNLSCHDCIWNSLQINVLKLSAQY